MPKCGLKITALIAIAQAVKDYPEPLSIPQFKTALTECVEWINGLGNTAKEFEMKIFHERRLYWSVASVLQSSAIKDTPEVFCNFRRLLNRLQRFQIGSQRAADVLAIILLAEFLSTTELFIEEDAA